MGVIYIMYIFPDHVTLFCDMYMGVNYIMFILSLNSSCHYS